jgi:hypothetical protein
MKKNAKLLPPQGTVIDAIPIWPIRDPHSGWKGIKDLQWRWRC